MSGQTKKHSFIEQLLNVGSGYIIAVILWAFIVTPYLKIPYNFIDNLVITTMFTVVSIVRGYYWRRLGNWITTRYHI